MPRSIALAVLLLSAGCTTTVVKSKPTTTTDGGTPTDSPDPTAAASPCPAYLGPITVGARWEYATDTSANGVTSTGNSVVTVKSAGESADGFTFVYSITNEAQYQSTQTSGTTRTTMESTYRCDDEGAHVVSSVSDLVNTANGTTTKTHSENRYTENFVMPKDLTASSTWTTAVRGTQTIDGKSRPVDFSYTNRVVSADSVRVDAGTFDALEVESTTTANGASSTTSNWYAKDVGRVKSTYDVLTSTSL